MNESDPVKQYVLKAAFLFYAHTLVWQDGYCTRILRQILPLFLLI
jgi:hypothetical protein